MTHDVAPADVSSSSESPPATGCAPLRLDIMGGNADYTGALLLSLPLADRITVEVRPRRDAMVCVDIRESRPDDPEPVTTVIPLSHLCSDDGRFRSVEQLASSWHNAPTPTRGLILGTWVEAVRRGLLPDRTTGLSFVVNVPISSTADLGTAAATSAATLLALCGLENRNIDLATAVALCHDVEYHVTRLPCGPGDAIAALSWQSAHLTQARGYPFRIETPLCIPDGVSFIGLDCHYRDTRRIETFGRARAATFMGARLINAILDHEDGAAERHNGMLTHVSMTDFVERFRDRLPTKLPGSEFIARFGQTGDPWTSVESQFIYKIRSRTEHHIYENFRCALFASRLMHFGHTQDRQTLIETGELLYASNWSLAQRYGMGSPTAERMVTLLRKRGAESGILGAKSAGRGCGGLIVVMIENSEKARDAVRAACREFANLGQREPRWFEAAGQKLTT